MQTGT